MIIGKDRGGVHKRGGTTSMWLLVSVGSKKQRRTKEAGDKLRIGSVIVPRSPPGVRILYGVHLRVTRFVPQQEIPLDRLPRLPTSKTPSLCGGSCRSRARPSLTLAFPSGVPNFFNLQKPPHRHTVDSSCSRVGTVFRGSICWGN